MKDELDKATVDAYSGLDLDEIAIGHYVAVLPPKITGKRYIGTTSPDSTRSNWRTPDYLFNYLDLRFGPFDVDLAACESSSKCDMFYGKEINSLVQDWTTHKRMFLNPPYDDIMPWAIKAVDTIAKARSGTTITVVLPNDNSTAWYAKFLSGCARVINIISDGKRSGRISFVDAGTNKPGKGNSKGTNVFILSARKGKGVVTEYISIKDLEEFTFGGRGDEKQ